MFTIYTRSNCTYCDQAKALLKRKGLEWTEIELTNDTFEEFKRKTNGAKTVPQVFYHTDKDNTIFIGGFDKLNWFIESWWDDKKEINEKPS